VSNSAPAYNYTDSFEAEFATADDRSPEQLARAVFEGAPRSVRWLLLAGWRFVLGLRLGPRPSPEHVLGWAIVERGPESVTLELRSWFLTSRLVFRIGESRATQATFVRYDRPIAVAIWPAVSIFHRQIVPRCLRRAVACTTCTQGVAGQPDPQAATSGQRST
jgi:hypothetical protein